MCFVGWLAACRVLVVGAAPIDGTETPAAHSLCLGTWVPDTRRHDMDGIVDSWKLPSPVASMSTSDPSFQLIDCHAHTYPSQFPHTDFLPLLRRAAAACVSHIVTVPETLADAHEILALAQSHPLIFPAECAPGISHPANQSEPSASARRSSDIFGLRIAPAIGLHPVQPKPCPPDVDTTSAGCNEASASALSHSVQLCELEPVLDLIRSKAECGLQGRTGNTVHEMEGDNVSVDTVEEGSKTTVPLSEELKSVQREVFRRQLSLSAELGLPVNVHSRSAGHHAIEEIVQSGLPATSAALMHAFDGRLVHAQRAERHGGFFFSVPPSIVRSPQKQKLVKGLPLSCLVLETDSPALAPEKGATNEPCNIVVSCREIARIHGVTVAEVAKTTSFLRLLISEAPLASSDFLSASHLPMAAVTLSQTATASCRATFSSVKLESKVKRSVSLAVQPAFAWKSAGVASTASFKGVGSVVVRAVAEDVQGGGNYGAPREIPGTKIYVGNLPFNVDSESLAEIFQEAGIVELVEVIYDRESGRSRGFGFVTMSTPEDAQAAIEKFDGSELGGRMLKVNMPVPRGERERGARNERPRGDRPRFGGNQSNKLYVGNLSWGMDDMALEDLFAEFGKVLEAKVVLDRDSGRSRGFGFVTLSSESEVQEAISNLDGADVDGRQLRVNVAAPKQ
ncbi:unnamed protein product [Closterium sp. Yama58-4]|nr:unnamed protein product [Closterium sp. Yama58-4]